MHNYLTARHFDLTDPIRAHVQSRLFDAIAQHADPHDLNRVEVQLSTGQHEERFGCHVLVQLPGHREVNVTEHGPDLYAAIEHAEKRVVHALVELRKRTQSNDRRPNRRAG